MRSVWCLVEEQSAVVVMAEAGELVSRSFLNCCVGRRLAGVDNVVC